MSQDQAAGRYRRADKPFIWIEIRIPGQRKIRFSSRTDDEQEALAAAHARLDALQSVSFQDAVVNLFENAPLKESTRRGYMTALGHLDGRFGDKALSEITREDLLAHIN